MPEARADAPPMRVLIVEDEALVALYLEDLLADLGFDVVGPIMRLEQALVLAEAGIAADAAVLDVNLGGHKVFPLAEKLEAAGLPMVFATGYGRAGIEARWHRFPIIQKPYTSADVAAALKAALDGA